MSLLNKELTLFLWGKTTWNGFLNTVIKATIYSTKMRTGSLKIWHLEKFGAIFKVILILICQKTAGSGTQSVVSHVFSEEFGLLDNYLLMIEGERLKRRRLPLQNELVRF